MVTSKIRVNQFLIRLFLAFLFLTQIGYSQENALPAVESFESTDILDRYSKSRDAQLHLTTDRHRFGKSALIWEWNGAKNSFGTPNFRILELDPKMLVYENIFPSSPTLVLSVYNEASQEGKVTITFQKNGNDQTWFTFPMTFEGWRTLRVPFFEMQGNSPEKTDSVDYDYFKVSADVESGKLYFDDIVFSQYMDNRYPYPDLMGRFIKQDQDRGIDHWMPLIENLERIQNLKAPSLLPSVEKELRIVQNRLNENLNPEKKQNAFSETKRSFKKLCISEKGGKISGPPLTYKSTEVYFDSLQQGSKQQNDIKFFGRLMKEMAEAFVSISGDKEKNQLEQDFLMASRYFLDQGWQKGVSGGTRHHIGYATRELTEAFYIMRESLEKVGLLTAIGESLQWLNNLGTILEDKENFHVNIDYLNTQAYYHLMVIFLSKEKEKQGALLKAYAKYLSIILAQQDEEWGFKPDGTSWHHNGHYPAYGLGAFQSVPAIFYILSGTSFRIGEAGHRNFKKALLMTTVYSQMFDWGFGNAGRHPLESTGGNTISSLQNSFLQMAFSGNTDGSAKIDKEVAEAYLRLWGKQDTVNQIRFTDIGISEQKMPGYRTLPYGATAIHRRNDWAAIIKGYSKYVWSSEIYAASNRYGRYPANGTIELLNAEGEEGSGIVQDGWDWNRYPGATMVYLPLEQLETERSLLMFLSEESFAGAAQLGDIGVFGMVLNESTGQNADGLVSDRSVGFPEKLSAKKSVFSFGGKLICIGTDISSSDKKNPTQTNLFQTFLKTPEMPMYLDTEGLVEDFPFLSNSGKWIVDPYGNGYHVLSRNPIQSHRREQHSYHNKYSVRTGVMNAKGKGIKETKGNFATAWINHGLAPKKVSYKYVIYPFLNETEQKSFAEIIKKDNSYRILREDDTAHIVSDLESATTGYVIFDSEDYVGSEILKRVSAPSIIMVRNRKSADLVLSAVQPDLNFPVNKNKKNGFENYSRPVELTVTLKGNWKLKEGAEVKFLKRMNNETSISLECQHGFSKEVLLIRTNQ